MFDKEIFATNFLAILVLHVYLNVFFYFWSANHALLQFFINSVMFLAE